MNVLFIKDDGYVRKNGQKGLKKGYSGGQVGKLMTQINEQK
jgi:hypothetical protein